MRERREPLDLMLRELREEKSRWMRGVKVGGVSVGRGGRR